MAEDRILIVPATPATVEIKPGRIRDLWSGSLHETGKCPKCGVVLGERHGDCKWADTIVGSNKSEYYL